MLRRLSEEHDLAPWFDQDDLTKLLAATELEPEDGKTDPYDVPEAPEDPITQAMVTYGSSATIAFSAVTPPTRSTLNA